MEPDQYERMAELQDHHWWFVAKRRIVDALIRKHATTPTPGQFSESWVLDAGCGTGSMLPVMRQWGRVVGADMCRQALRYASHGSLIEADILNLPFADRSFRLLGCFDVLYHRRVEDIEAVLLELHRVCHQNGVLVITDSALPVLRSSHDAALHGARRFRLRVLKLLLEDAGFQVIYGSYFHTLLFPVAAIVRLIKRVVEGTPDLSGLSCDKNVTPHSDLRPFPRWVNSVLSAVYEVEAALLRRARLPIGLSVVVIARPIGIV